MKKLAYIPFAANAILFVYVAAFIIVPRKGFLIDVFSFCWGNLNMQYINPAEYILLFVSLIVPFVRVRLWVRIATPLLGIGHFILMEIFWDIFKFP